MRHANQRFTVGMEPAGKNRKTRTGVQRGARRVSSAELAREIGPSEMAARLDRLADVRGAVVARGKALIADPNYPSRKITRAVAGLLASKWAAS